MSASCWRYILRELKQDALRTEQALGGGLYVPLARITVPLCNMPNIFMWASGMYA